MPGQETVFTMEATPVKFGPGAVADAGWELGRLGVSHVLLVTDPDVAALGLAERAAETVRAAGIRVTTYADSRIEPTLESLEECARAARAASVDGFMSVGGGSSIDHAKVADLLTTHPAPIRDYVNRPLGGGQAPPGPLLPHLAIPTTSGSGSEATSVAVLDLPDERLKTGISHRYLRPAQAIVDPELTRSVPPEVTASAGLDVICHAAESYLARPFDARPVPASPAERPPYQGSNPIADVWSAKALELGGRYLRRAVSDPGDVEARGYMMLAATMAGVGFGSAGVHIPHACAYPIAGLSAAKEYRPAGYPGDHPFVPHGHSVIVTAPAAFAFTYDALPERHHAAAALLTGAVQTGREALPDALRALMGDVGAPTGIAEFGYGEADIAALVAGAVKQERLLAVAPAVPTPADLRTILEASLRW